MDGAWIRCVWRLFSFVFMSFCILIYLFIYLFIYFNNKITSIRASITHDGNKADYSEPRNVTMRRFTSITLDELCKTVSECNSSDIDPVPTAFFKRVFNSVSSPVLDIINFP